jgi:predicted  nucleic acid-binding Zn-ribbon protein
MNLLLAVLGLAAGRLAQTKKQSPVEAVVELITELQAKIQADGDAEQKLYDKFACWCESTTQRKANAIDDAKATIGKTTTLILTLKGGISVLSSEIADLNADIAKNNEAMKSLTSIREKENSDYQQEKAFTETALSSLHAAIEVLSGAGTGGDLGLLKVASNVRTALLGSTKLAELPKEKSAVLKNFLEQPADYYDKKAQAKASYSPQSATIIGILKDMYDTFAADMEKSNQEESNMQMAFEAEMEEKVKQNKQFTEMVTEKEGQKAEKTQMLAENEEKLEATTEQMKLDEEFFATTTESCKGKAADWEERSRLRTMQLDGITKALAILTSDEAKATFESATSTRPQDTFGSDGVAFVQIQQDPREKAYNVLKKLTRNTKNLRLARLAVTVKTAAKGHFDEVISAIDEMIQLLKDEGQTDITQRDWCINEQNVEENHKSDLEYQIEKLQATIERLGEKKLKLEAEVAATEKSRDDLQAELDTALAYRTPRTRRSRPRSMTTRRRSGCSSRRSRRYRTTRRTPPRRSSSSRSSRKTRTPRRTPPSRAATTAPTRLRVL